MTLRPLIDLLEASSKLEKLQMNPLPYSMSALEPAMSRENVRVHYKVLTANYFKKYEETGDLFQKAGAVLHNDFFWPMLKAYDRKNKPSAELEAKIKDSHSSLDKFKEKVLEEAKGLQGNGWVFVMQDLQVISVQNHLLKPGIVLGIDLWEHSTRDFDFQRVDFLEEFWNIVNWDLIEEKLTS